MDMGAMAAAVLSRWRRIVLVTLVLLAVAFVMLHFTPKMYESEAGILVEPRQSVYTSAANGTVPATPASGQATISSQIELIRSRGTLMDVINTENLRDVPELNGSLATGLVARVKGLLHLGGKPGKASDQTVLANVADHLSVIRERDSNIITIIYRSTDPNLAARVANAIARAHVRRRAGQSLTDTADATKWLSEEIAKLKAQVTDAEAKVAAFKIDNDLYQGSNDTSLIDQQLSAIASQITAAQERQNTAKSRATLIRGLLKAGQPIDSVPDVRASVIVQQLSEQKASLQGERAQKLATLLPNHPQIKALTAQIGELDKQINAEGLRVAGALEAEAKIESGVVQSLRDDLTRMKSEASKATTDAVTLNRLERDAKADRDLLQTYMLRYRDAAGRTETNSALPDVRIISQAAAAVSPASPKTKLVLGAVAAVSLVLQLGQILFVELITGRALVEVRRDPPMPAGDVALEDTPWADDPRPYDDAAPGEATAPDDASWFDEEAEVHAGAAAEWYEQSDADDASYPPELPYDEPDDGETHVREQYPADQLDDATVPDDDEYEAETAAVASAPDSDILFGDGEAAMPGIAPSDAPTVETEPSEIAARIIDNNDRLVLVGAFGNGVGSRALTEALAAELVARGKSVAEIDAGSQRTTHELGLTDLCEGRAEFGDVVHRGQRSDLALVPWGQMQTANLASERTDTLVEALGDIFEIVIIDTGLMGMTSSMPIFVRNDALVLLAAGENADVGRIYHALEDIRGLGCGRVEIANIDEDSIEVA